MSSSEENCNGLSILVRSLQKYLVLCNFCWDLRCGNTAIWNKCPSPFQVFEEHGRSLLYI
uniref:Uncharacterized protein n=1 Tax=Rhizophora mucronata TaxID=61149 RepID=A0A2P2IPD1_RHIMU